MSDFANLKGPGLNEGIVQAILDGKKWARNLENAVESIAPMLENQEWIAKLEEIREAAAKAAYALQQLYNRNAKEAFGVKQNEG